LKENLKVKSEKSYLKENPLVVSKGNNKFLNDSKFIEAVNNAKSNV
jgi:hypothetical protein